MNRCPSSPNPVTSVAARSPAATAARDASALSAVIVATACGNTSPVALCRDASTPRPSGLVRLSGIPRDRGILAQQPVGVAEPGDGHPVERLGRVDRVAAGDRAARPRRATSAPPRSTSASSAGSSRPARPADEVHREHRLAPHRPDVGHRVRGDDPAPVVGVVDDRGEEVDGADDGPAAVDPQHRGVVAGLGAHEQVGVPGQVDPGEQRLELADRHLAGAPTARGVRRHPDHAVPPSSTLG